jgi:hypothetical protein
MSLFRAITRTMLKATLVRGRFFTDAEDASKPEVVVINQALAQKYFPKTPSARESPITRAGGRRSGRLSAWWQMFARGHWIAIFGPRNISPSTRHGTLISA